MRLRSSDKIAGFSALRVRSLLRRLNQDFWTVKKAAHVLKVPEERARRLVYSLRTLGYVEGVSQQPRGTWRNTMAGNALANATAAEPISRSAVDRWLKDFLARVGVVNGDDSWLYRVGKVVLFGSCLSDQERVGDIDLAIRLDRRPEYAGRWADAVMARAAAAENRGRRFHDFVDRLGWAETEVKRYLRAGARFLSLHDWSKEEPWLAKVPHQVLFEEPTAAASAEAATQKHSDGCRVDSREIHVGSHRRHSRRRGNCPF